MLQAYMWLTSYMALQSIASDVCSFHKHSFLIFLSHCLCFLLVDSFEEIMSKRKAPLIPSSWPSSKITRITKSDQMQHYLDPIRSTADASSTQGPSEVAFRESEFSQGKINLMKSFNTPLSCCYFVDHNYPPLSFTFRQLTMTINFTCKICHKKVSINSGTPSNTRAQYYSFVYQFHESRLHSCLLLFKDYHWNVRRTGGTVNGGRCI